jgi:hypothetical protein
MQKRQGGDCCHCTFDNNEFNEKEVIVVIKKERIVLGEISEAECFILTSS